MFKYRKRKILVKKSESKMFKYECYYYSKVRRKYLFRVKLVRSLLLFYNKRPTFSGSVRLSLIANVNNTEIYLVSHYIIIY